MPLMFALAQRFRDDKGRSPKWVVALSEMFFFCMWMTYDGAYKRIFGDGERTEGLDDDNDDAERFGEV